MKCPRCQYENPPESNFCLGCGTRLGARGYDGPRGLAGYEDAGDVRSQGCGA
jgi:zinc ribbon protein